MRPEFNAGFAPAPVRKSMREQLIHTKIYTVDKLTDLLERALKQRGQGPTGQVFRFQASGIVAPFVPNLAWFGSHFATQGN